VIVAYDHMLRLASRIRPLNGLGTPIVEWSGSAEAEAPLVVLMHGWGETEVAMTALVPALPTGPAYASVRAPYVQGRHFAWFQKGQSFVTTVRWFETWLDGVQTSERPVILVVFSAGAAFAGGTLLLNPQRYMGAAILVGTLPFDAGVETPTDCLVGKDLFLVQSTGDAMIPAELLERAWNYLTESSGARIHARRYEGGHGVSGQMLSDLGVWLEAIAVG
jgi:phospholipase/carboxylesterase